MPEFPRRCDTLRHSAAEAAILEALREVEAIPADPRLTDAVTFLQLAHNAVADFVDGVQRREPKWPALDP